MRHLGKLVILVALAAVLLTGRKSDAELMLFTIRAPRDCPEGLSIKTKPGQDRTLEFDVYVDPEAVAHAGELYKGRVRSNAILSLSTGGQQIASVTVHGATEGKRTRYQFSVAPSVARTSELQLGVSLFEKDGFPTLGGGVSMIIHLAGFEPTRPSKPNR